MKKYLWIFLIISLIIGIIIFVNSNKNYVEDEGYVAKRTVFESNNSNEKNNIVDEKENVEETLAEFSTTLPNETEARDDNVKLACKTLNGTIVKSKKSFSLWKILGCPTKEAGYEKAKTFTSEGEIIKSYGGGICQISTTIYNAVLKVDGLKVTERHEHSREVPYLEDGKDAAVAYNTADLKFENTLEDDIKIEAKIENRKVKIKLIRIS